MNEGYEKRIKSEWLNRRRGENALRIAACVMCGLAVIWLSSVQLVASCGGFLAYHQLAFSYKLENALLPAAVCLIFFAAIRRLTWAFALSSVFVTVWSVANCYTFLYTGNVITPALLGAFPTAMNVIGGYSFSLNESARAVLILLPIELLLAFCMGRLWPGVVPLKRAAIVALCCALALSGCFFLATREEMFESFRAEDVLNRFGYSLYFVRKTASGKQTVRIPPLYGKMDAEDIKALYPPTEATAAQYPDIILILNESFYDMERYTDLQADIDPLADWRSIENAMRGYVAVAGGTNTTEFELLTGNSTLLFDTISPFVNLDLTKANSVARYFKQLGYETFAMHEADSANYGRGLGYPALGFDHVLFEDDFSYTTWYGQRKSTDASNYMDLLDKYVSAQEGPRFFYLLTYQNHGGYDQNSSELDTVHVQADFGRFTGAMDEYLTSVRMSCEALAGLLKYLDRVERPVLVCMLGDHNPYLTSFAPTLSGLLKQEADMLVGTTPFLLWANEAFGHLKTVEEVRLTATDVMPLIFKTAGLPLSTFYRCILDVSSQIPFRLKNGVCQTAEGEYTALDTDDIAQIMMPYFQMEYDGLMDAAGARDYFAIPGI